MCGNRLLLYFSGVGAAVLKPSVSRPASWLTLLSLCKLIMADCCCRCAQLHVNTPVVTCYKGESE